MRESNGLHSAVIENLDPLRHIALGDLIDAYRAAGFTLVLSLEE